MSLAKPFVFEIPGATAVLTEPPAPIGNRMHPTSILRADTTFLPGRDQNTANMRNGGSRPYPPIVKPRLPFVFR